MHRNDLITIDGSQGEGGGQILRSALALALVTEKPFRIEKIRAGRDKPGLLRQHLTAVHAAQRIGQARVQGDAIGSQMLDFEPATIVPGEYQLSVGTAGSTTLVLQTVLLPLALLASPAIRRRPEGIVAGAFLAVLGFVMNRLNVSVTGMEGAAGVRYLPSWMEITVSLGLVALGMAAFGLAVRFLPIFGPEHAAAGVEGGAALRLSPQE
jgi:hypothetical protein